LLQIAAAEGAERDDAWAIAGAAMRPLALAMLRSRAKDRKEWRARQVGPLVEVLVVMGLPFQVAPTTPK
jgi:hypothetical protein